MIKELVSIMEKTISYTKDDIPDSMIIKKLGEGWTGEEAIAVAVYASLKYRDDFKQAIVCAANHDGNSDSTASITGNIVGAYIGIDRAKERFNIKLLGLYDVICISSKERVHDYVKEHDTYVILR